MRLKTFIDDKRLNSLISCIEGLLEVLPQLLVLILVVDVGPSGE